MNKFIATGLAAAFALSLAIEADATTITVTKNVVKVTHDQCVLTRMGRAKTDEARVNADKWCIKHGDTIPRKW
jgi:uncharacterized low-complexity protein